MEWERIEAVRQIVITLYNLSSPPTGVNKIIRETIFFLYEGGDSLKWSFDRPHSAAAKALHREALSAGKKFAGRGSGVTYDHAIPWDSLGESWRDATDSYETMRAFLIRHIQGVVILKEEEVKLSKSGLRRRLPPDAQSDDMLARYYAAGIALESQDEAKLKRRTL